MFGEEEDQQEVEFVMPPLPNLDLALQPEEKITCQTLYIAFYGVSSLFVSTLVDTQKPIARINFQKSKQKSLASVYSSADAKSTFIIFNEQFQKMKEIHFASFIRKNFGFDRIYILTSVAKGLLEKDDGINLKYLKTSKGKEFQYPKFPQGITGPEADILQWAQINGVEANCFVGIYSDYEINRKIVDEIFGNLQILAEQESRYDIVKQIKGYNMTKYGNKIYL